jgi:hypothetical protein
MLQKLLLWSLKAATARITYLSFSGFKVFKDTIVFAWSSFAYYHTTSSIVSFFISKPTVIDFNVIPIF